MKKVLSLLLALCFVSAMLFTFTTPANASTDQYADVITPYYDESIIITADDLTKDIQVTVYYEGHYIFQTFGDGAVYRMRLYTSHYSLVKSNYYNDLNGHGFQYNCLIGVYLTPGTYYLEITYNYACNSRFSITYASDYFYGHWDSNNRLYLQDYYNIELDTVLEMGATFDYYNKDTALISLVEFYEDARYRVHVEGDASAVAYLVDPSTVYTGDSAVSTYYSPGEIDVRAGIPYYLVVHINGLYGNDPVNPVESITVWVYLERIG